MLNRSAICLSKLRVVYLTIPRRAGIASSSIPLAYIHSSSKHSLKLLVFRSPESLQKEILIPALQLKECLLKRISKALHHSG